MSKLCLICITVLFSVSIRECSQTYRHAMDMAERDQARSYAEHVRKNPLPGDPLRELFRLPLPSPTPSKEGTKL